MNEQAIDGILGADVLFPTHAVLDCRNQMLILKIDPNVRGGVPGMNYAGYSRVPMSVSTGYNLYVDGSVNGRKAKLMVDTGAFATLLHRVSSANEDPDARNALQLGRGEPEAARRAHGDDQRTCPSARCRCAAKKWA